MSNTGWTFKHEDAVDESGLHRNVTPPDLRGLRLRLESGYTWVNCNDGKGWRQTKRVLMEMQNRAAVGLEPRGYALDTMQTAEARREAKARRRK